MLGFFAETDVSPAPAQWAPRGRRAAVHWWLVATPGEPLDVCPKQPGFPVDALVTADIAVLIKVWLGYRGLTEAERAGEVRIEAYPSLLRTKSFTGSCNRRATSSSCTFNWNPPSPSTVMDSGGAAPHRSSPHSGCAVRAAL